jgi:TonB family protein
VRPDNLLDLFEIDPAAAVPDDGAPAEPRLKTGPLLVGFDEPEGLEPDPAPVAPTQSAPPRRRTLPFGLAGSIAVHLLPLLVLVNWSGGPAEDAAPIPVQLVLEEPPPAPRPPPAPKPPPPKPAGPLASVDIGEPAGKPDTTEPLTPQAAEPQEPQVAVAAPPPKPLSPPEPASPHKPAPAPEPAAKPHEQKPAPATPPPVKPAVAAPPSSDPHPAPHAGRIPGPAATQDEYLAYIDELISRYNSFVPASLLAGRKGVAIISIVVLGDGTIARIAVKQSSGYPDIDQRAEQMVAAAHRFPPLPQWFQGTSMVLNYHLIFGGPRAER